MLKQIQLSDRSVRPFKVFKDWKIDLVTNDNLILTEGSDIIDATPETSTSLSESLALEYQNDLSHVQVSIGENSPTSLFYDSSSRYYNSETNPLDWTGHYKRSIYDVVKCRFYNENRYDNWGIETLGRQANGEYIERREIFDKIRVAKIPQLVFGETIVPGTFSAIDYTNPSQTVIISDDGNTNLTATNSFRIGNKLSQLTHRIDGEYETDNDRFGYSLNANGGYLIVGSPMFKDSFGYSKPGLANLFKYSLSEKRYKFLKEFYSPDSQEALERELGEDYFIDTEQGGFLLSTTGSNGELSVIDQFGYSVSVTDEFLAIGAPQGLISSGTFQETGSGMVFVYDRNKGGIDNWGLINVFSGSSISDRFGSSVAIDGDRIVIGAEGQNLVYVYSKKVYMSSDECESVETSSGDPYFVSGNNTWVFDQTLEPAQNLNGFGGTVAIDGDIIVVGSKTEQTTQKAFVYEFEQSGSDCITGSWNSTCILTPTSSFSKSYVGSITRNTSSIFGHDISINDNIIAVGDPKANSYQFYSELTSGSTLTTVLEDDAADDDTADWTDVSGVGGTLTFVTDYYQMTPDFIEHTIYKSGSIVEDGATYQFSIDINHDPGASFNLIRTNGSLFNSVFVPSSVSASIWLTYTGSFVASLAVDPTYDKFGLNTFGGGLKFRNFTIQKVETSSAQELNPSINIGSTYIYKSGISPEDCCFYCEEYPTSSVSCSWGPLQVIEGDTDRLNYFGYSIDIDGNNMIVGSPFNLSLSASYDSEFDFEKKYLQLNEGVSKIYNLNETETFYSQSGEIYNESLKGEIHKIYGHDVSVDNNYAFVGAPAIYPYSGSEVPDSDEELEGNVYSYRIRNIGETAHMGNIFYKNGLVVLTNTSSQFENVFGSVYEMSFQSQHTIYEEEYIITVNSGEFNVSQNPTALVETNLIYDINGNGQFDFEDLDLILRYINKYKIYVNTQAENSSEESDDGFTLEQDLFSLESDLSTEELIRKSVKAHVSDESWWNNDILLMESEDVLITSIEENIEQFFTDSKLSESYIVKLQKLEEDGYLDINGDGVVDAFDANIILRYFNNIRTEGLVDGVITDESTRTTAFDIRTLLDEYTGTNVDHVIHPHFYNYIESSSYDKTGSYLSPFITTIGLYDSEYNLVGIAKLGTPVKVLQDYPINFIVSWDK